MYFLWLADANSEDEQRIIESADLPIKSKPEFVVAYKHRVSLLAIITSLQVPSNFFSITLLIACAMLCP